MYDFYIMNLWINFYYRGKEREEGGGEKVYRYERVYIERIGRYIENIKCYIYLIFVGIIKNLGWLNW